MSYVCNRNEKNKEKSVVLDSATSIRKFKKWMDDMHLCRLKTMVDETRLFGQIDGS